MPLDYPCPSCQQPLQVPESYLGRTIACPSCKHTFKVGTAIAPPPPPPPPPPAPPPAPARARDFAFDDDRGRDDDDERLSPRERRRREDDEDYYRSKADGYYTMGVLSCVLCIFPIVGVILGALTMSNASTALSDLRRDRVDSPRVRRTLHSASSLGTTGIVLSIVLAVSCCGIRIAMLR